MKVSASSGWNAAHVAASANPETVRKGFVVADKKPGPERLPQLPLPMLPLLLLLLLLLPLVLVLLLAVVLLLLEAGLVGVAAVS
jgi:hypothetical protein